MNDYLLLKKIIKCNIKNCGKEGFCIGKTFLGQKIYAFHKGSYFGKQLLITAGIHAREYISCFVVQKLMQDYNLPFGCYFVPAVNLDGIGLCCCGLDFVKDKQLKDVLKRLNNNSTNFKLWKANIRGVDLNTNFDAGFGKSKFACPLPCSGGFAGEKPNSECENIALIKFAKTHSVDFSLAYHSKGEVVYYGFEDLKNDVLKKESQMASLFAKNLKYKKIRSIGSTGGLGDFLGQKFGIPSITIELGNDSCNHPIDLKYFDEIYKNQYDALKKFVENYDRFT